MVKADSVREVTCSNGSFRNRSDDPSHHVTPIICSNMFLKVAYSVVVIPNTVSGSFYMCNKNGHFNILVLLLVVDVVVCQKWRFTVNNPHFINNYCWRSGYVIG